jgi:hypothetical protein
MSQNILGRTYCTPGAIVDAGFSEEYSLISLFAGWWGIPAGPIWTVVTIIRNTRGGIDLTPAVEAVVCGSAIAAGGYS